MMGLLLEKVMLCVTTAQDNDVKYCEDGEGNVYYIRMDFILTTNNELQVSVPLIMASPPQYDMTLLRIILYNTE
eukprot:scaffold82964_cov98-Attheya_sp.AAC.1